MSTPGRRGQTEEVVLAAAADLLAARDDASMAEIAEAAGVGRATLYRHYATKDELLRALAVDALTQAHRAMDQANVEHVPAPQAVERLFRAVAGVASRYTVVARDHSLHDAADAERCAMAERLRALLAAWQAEGALRQDVPTEWLLVALKGAIMATVDLAGRAGVEDAAAFGARQFLFGAQGVAVDGGAA